ncbi:MAG: benzoate-CoA ligase family protein [Hyphomicrobiales bacterium]|nr:benzoate-CoA ligase family protein [Hyphomicrobiales bacterium]
MTFTTAPYTAHVDPFAREHLPPSAEMPDFIFMLPELRYPERLNCVVELLDNWLAKGHGARPCFRSLDRSYSYAEFAALVNRIANVLVAEYGLIPGNRVLLRSPNTPLMAAALFAVMKAGGIAVTSMPLLRAKELAFMCDKAKVALALCDHRFLEELEKAKLATPALEKIVPMGGGSSEDLNSAIEKASAEFTACPTSAEDICLIAFTSGTTGVPKGAMHNHRDMLATCDTYGKYVLEARPTDVFIGSPPLAFTFGLGGGALFSLRIGASSILLEQAAPDKLMEAIRTLKPTVCFTAPIAYRAMLGKLQPGDLASLRICVSAGEALPGATWGAWKAATGIEILDGIGSTEMLHIFIGAPAGKIKAGSTGIPVPGYEAKIVDDEGRELPRGSTGLLAVRGPTGCRYLADPRQTTYVRNGWNFTGDTYRLDEDGYFWHQARSDDMIVSAGYNIAGPEVEGALLSHPAVLECAVVGAPDLAHDTTIVKAYVVLRAGHQSDGGLVAALQEHVRSEIAPYKFPRVVTFVEALPRTESGKVQRFVLRERARREAEEGAGK